MNQRYGEQRDNGEGQQYGQGRFGQMEHGREGYGREEYRGGYGGPERHGERHMGRSGEGQFRRYGEGQRVQGYYSGGGSGEGGGRDFERTPYYGAMGYRDEGPWRGEYGRRAESGYGGMREGYGEGRQDEVWSGEGRFGEGRMVQGQYGQGQYGQGRYGEEGRRDERYREREWESGRGRRGGLLARLFGRGPKGYKRSDERIKEDICEQLWRSESIDSSEVTIAVKEGEVILSGTVPERWMRHEIENIADDSMGVQNIDNNIRIQRQTEETSTEAASAARGTAAGTKK
jgi:hypothetical protein